MPVKRQRTKDVGSRRAQIFQTAAQIFRDRGFDGTSVGDVARALRITKAGLYHYVSSKEALLCEILSFGLDQVRDEVAEPARKVRDPEARLRVLVVRLPGAFPAQVVIEFKPLHIVHRHVGRIQPLARMALALTVDATHFESNFACPPWRPKLST